MSETLFIRADASPTIGTGHVMRMIALAQAWIDRGGVVVFISISCPESLVERIKSEQILHKTIDAKIGSADDAAATLTLANQAGCSSIVVDGYRFGYDFQNKLHLGGKRILVVDDFAYESKWCADAILNQNLFAEDWIYVSERPELKSLLGCRFALLRREINQHSADMRSSLTRGTVRLLITLGGGDSATVSSQLIEHIPSNPAFELKIRLLIGSAGASDQTLQKTIDSSQHHIELAQDVKDMSAEYLHTDAVISGAGSTCWEWLYFRLPAAVVRLADNQVPNADAICQRGLALDLGWPNQFSVDSGFSRRLEGFLTGVSQASHSADRVDLIDGQGADRVCQVLERFTKDR